MAYISECKQQLRTMKEYTQIRDIAHWAVVLSVSESCAIINDLYVILQGFMLQIINTSFPSYNLTLHVRFFNHLTWKTVV